jgi:hypothetical protein
VLAALAPSMCLAVRRANTLSPLGAAVQLALPPAHGTPPATVCRPNPKSTALRHPQPSPTPSQPSTIRWCTPDTTYTTVAVREQVRRWVQHVSTKVVRALGRDVRWACSRGGWSGTPQHPPPPGSQAACTSCRFPTLDGRFEHTHSPPLHGVHSTTEGHLGVYLLSEGGLSCVWGG